MMFAHRTVLVADDQSSSRESLREILRQSSFQMIGTANTTDETLDQVIQLQPDAVIIDVTLPGTVDALVAIKQMRRAQPFLSIFATGMMSQNMIVMEALSMGAADFFLKPFQLKTVHNCLQKNLG